MDEIIGTVERITFQSNDTGYTVAQLRVARQRDLVCVVGTMPTLRAGETVRCSGSWKNHPMHGRQFETTQCRTEAPSDLLGIRKYLASGLIKGIGPVYAERIVDKFGLETLQVIDQCPGRLNEVAGIGGKRLDRICSCWSEQKSIREVMIFLQGHEVSPAYAQKIFRCYGPEAIQKVKDNPYRLARDVHGIGFKTADTIAQKLGIPRDAVGRVDAGVEYVLNTFAEAGHVCVPQNELLDAAKEALAVDATRIEERFAPLSQEHRIVLEAVDGSPMVWSKPLHVCENGIARELARLCRSRSALRAVDTVKALEWVQERLSLRLADNQKAAVSMAVQEKVAIITGGPGTGKSTITKAILAISRQLSHKILLAAPTGRAAKRLAEITRSPASTIHSLLQFDFTAGGFKHNRDNPLDTDLLIVDEASMIDTLLMYGLLKAVPDNARVIFVGDVHQLPSVGPGNVLQDLLLSERLPFVRLTEIFRQARGSHIITNAHRINEGLFPFIQNDPKNDFFFLEALEPQQVADTIVGLVSDRLPKKYGWDPIDDIQVLAPMKRGIVGTHNLNALLQERLNPNKDALLHFGNRYLVGDKVMQIRNNYRKEVFNGDVGRIQAIDTVEQEVTVCVDDREVVYDFSELDELQLAYAVSIHKYQGSESPCVVLPVHTTHFKLLHRNLLYTGVTRGKRLVVLVGTKKAIAIAVNNNEALQRHTCLRQRMATALR